ncbi:MAG: tRNA uridine-5-carboxymethylaminomethyl(34) synthesis GTPase MnmE [Mycoplasmoidaceae bacterium]|nr:MAG: tRNA uridine-5-carboxymethylaminomethyl(34) synthesis GTPase MnmE [Mycoplasmoidaceae bacterium]
MNNSTIVSLATAPINSAIHIIRLSGDDTYKIINKISDKKVIREGYKIQMINILDNKKILDNVLIMKFVSPKSFTGEDLLEINCHGGIFLANKIIGLLISNGAKLANKGEYSKRAFMNNKISLNQANAINNLISSSSESAINFSHNGLNKETDKKLNIFINTLFTLIGEVEINIDYPEYDDVPNITKKQFLAKLNDMSKSMTTIIESSSKSIKSINGLNLLIVGKPNVGKSSLLNALLEEEKAIVSSTPGTTRDVVEGKLNIKGITFNIIDTAGIRKKTKDKIESIGISNSLKNIEKADIILFVIDGSKKMTSEDYDIFNIIKQKQYIVVSNKSDLSQTKSDIPSIKICAKKKDISNLITTISNASKKLFNSNNDTIMLQSNAAIGYLKQVKEKIQLCIDKIKTGISFDLIMEDLHEAHQNLLKIIGKDVDYEFIDEMFNKFCLGK